MRKAAAPLFLSLAGAAEQFDDDFVTDARQLHSAPTLAGNAL